MITNYLELIEWIRSPKNTNKDYSITLLQSCILQRLMKYSKRNKNITYSNEIISEHMFRTKKQIENNLPILTQKGLITTTIIRSQDDKGNFMSKRTIQINWVKLNEIKTEMDEYLSHRLKDDNSQPKKHTKQEYQLEKSDDNQSEDTCSTEEDNLGYSYVEQHGESYLIKNQNSVFLRFMEVGDQLSLYFLNNEGKKELYTRTYKKKIQQYFDINGIEFKDLTRQDLINMN